MAMGVEATWAQVTGYLERRYGEVVEEADGSLRVTHGDRRLYVLVLPFGEESSVVQILSPLVVDVADSDELCEELATAELVFGKFLLVGAPGGPRTVLFAHRLLGDRLDDAELDVAMGAVAATADRLDPLYEERFGARWTLEVGE